MIRYETNPEWECVVRYNEDGSVSSFPTDPANSDYQAYLRWLKNPDAEITPPTL